MLTDFITPADPRWQQVLRAVRHDIYDLPQYLALSAAMEDAEPLGFYAAEGSRYCLVPLLRRRLPGGLQAPPSWTDAISPYGYSGALFTEGADWAQKAARALVAECAAHDMLSVFVRLHPLLPAPASALDAAGVRIAHGETVYVDLRLPEKELRAQMRPNHRTGLRRLSARGYRASLDNWDLYPRFVDIYGQTMERLEAGAWYRFPGSYFADLRTALGRHLHLVSVLAPGGQVAAAGLFTELEGIVQYHLGGTAGEYRHEAPSKLMIEAAIAWAKSAGHHMLHLGGGLGASEDSLFHFKAGFSRCRATFQTWRIVCDQARYAAIARSVPSAGSEYFPAYRKAA